MNNPNPIQNFQNQFTGVSQSVPLLNGKKTTYINFDNAASTPSMKPVQVAVNNFLNFYSSVHRGTGFKSQLSTQVYEDAREIVLDFVGASPREHTCIFGKNTTEAINKLANRFPFTPERNVVITSAMEHHSNDLPWRNAARVVHVDLTPDGRLDEADFDRKLSQYADSVALVSITGASNVTGFLNPIHRIAEKTHQVGGHICVDAAQLAPHRKIDMKSLDDPGHLDFLTISAHKMYAPFGTGALIGRLDVFSEGMPDLVGGGTVQIVTLEDVIWAGSPDRDEAGSPNVVGAVALAAAINALEKIGMDNVAHHEAQLTSYTLSKLSKLDGIEIYGDSNPETATDRLGVIPVNLKGISHFLAASILGHEFGIGVRNGCFCAHPYLLHLLGLSKDEADQVRDQIIRGHRVGMPGLVRISFGLYNTTDEIDSLLVAISRILNGEYQGDYTADLASGEYHPADWSPDFSNYFTF